MIDGVRLATGVTGTVTRSAIAGGTRIEAVFGAPLGAGQSSPLSLQVSVPAGATADAIGRVRLGGITLERGPVTEPAVRSDDAVIVASYFMDTSGNRQYSMTDVQRLNRVIAGLDTGFAAHPNVDPVLIGDLNGNGQLTTLDANRFLQFVQGQPRSEIPPLPAAVQPVTLGDAVRAFELGGSTTASPGALLSVPLVVDGSAGLESVRATLRFDADVLEYRGFRAVEAFEYRLVRAAAGVVTLDIARVHGLPAGLSNLLELDFAVKPNAASGSTLIDLEAVVYDDTRVPTGAPNVPGQDDGDAVIVVTVPLPPAPPVLSSAAMSASGLRAASVPLGVPAGVGAPVNWSEQLSAPATLPPPAPAAVDWKSAPWARDLASRLDQMEPGGNESAPGSARSVLFRALTRLSRR